MAATFWEHPVTVRVPATSANLGPGFDSMGLALGLSDDVTVQVVSGGLSVVVEGEGSGTVPLDENHLIVRCLRTAYARMDAAPGGLLVHCVNSIPHARGLGSSSAAIVAALWAARATIVDGDERLRDDDLVALASELEGHPDNVAPCLLGALTIAWSTASGAHAVRREPVAGVQALAVVPPTPVATELARGLLPDSVPHADAVFNAARTGLLVSALTDDGLGPAERRSQLLVATDDRLHQPYRSSAMPDSAALVARMRDQGVPAFISGAGPTVLALIHEGDDVDRLVAATDAAEVGKILVLPIDIDGARVVAG